LDCDKASPKGRRTATRCGRKWTICAATATIGGSWRRRRELKKWKRGPGFAVEPRQVVSRTRLTVLERLEIRARRGLGGIGRNARPTHRRLDTRGYLFWRWASPRQSSNALCGFRSGRRNRFLITSIAIWMRQLRIVRVPGPAKRLSCFVIMRDSFEMKSGPTYATNKLFC